LLALLAKFVPVPAKKGIDLQNYYINTCPSARQRMERALQKCEEFEARTPQGANAIEKLFDRPVARITDHVTVNIFFDRC